MMPTLEVLVQQFLPSGPCPAQVMVVGEAPGEREVLQKLPFVGPSGFELDKMMLEAGLNRDQAFVTNVCRSRPPANDIENFMAMKVKDRGPEHKLLNGQWVNSDIILGRDLLLAEIELCRPTIILAFGNLALWALTGKWGVKKWRGSVLQGEHNGHQFKVIPTYHPAAVLRQYDLRPTVVHDLRRAQRELKKGPIVTVPDYRFIIRPSYNTARYFLEHLQDLAEYPDKPLRLAVDIETRAGHMACIGIAWSDRDAICIPLMCLERTDGYWTADEEALLTHRIRLLLTHPNVEVVGQNFLYDAQYFYRHHHYLPRLVRDTMIAQHTLFSSGQKGLDYLASMYCDHYEYWKDEGKEWDTSMPEDDYWGYNCKDAVNTWEVDAGQRQAIAELTPSWPKLPEIQAFQQRLFWPVLKTMNRGIRSDQKARGKMAEKLMNALSTRQAYIDTALGRPLNIRSSKQMTELFYTELNQKEIRKRGQGGVRGNLTCDDEALVLLAAREPMLRPFIKRIQEMRSMGVFLSTFVNMPLDRDGRIRCQFKVAGTISYRFASSENAFGTGGNLQNIPKGDEDDEDPDSLPNIRELFLPDEGRTVFDIDLDSADLRIVTGESDCKGMQAYFDAGAKPYVEIAKEYFHDPSITKRHPSYRTMKSLCHGTNYLGEAAGLASRTGLLVHEVDRVQKWYFQKNPEIRKWQEDLMHQISSRRYIENVFGYRCYFFGRIEKSTFREGVAWMPQSTVGCLINRAYVNIDENLPWAEVLLQVHDSLAGQFPTHMGDMAVRAIVEQAQVPLPYATPLTIPVGVKTSTESWGACG